MLQKFSVNCPFWLLYPIHVHVNIIQKWWLHISIADFNMNVEKSLEIIFFLPPPPLFS